MDEGDDIDIIADESFLNCDYTVHPQWLSDELNTNPWFNAAGNSRGLENDPSQDPSGHIISENSISDESGWRDREKELLVQGILRYGENVSRLAQYIGTRTRQEVRYYLNRFFSENHPPESLVAYQNACQSEAVQILDTLNPQGSSTTEPVFISDTDTMKTKAGTSKNMESKDETPPARKKTKMKRRTKIKGRQPVDPFEQYAAHVSRLPPEEVVHLKKHEDSDMEVNVEDDCEVETSIDSEDTVAYLNSVGCSGSEHETDISDELSSLDIPTQEVILDNDSLTDLESYVFRDILQQPQKDEESTEYYFRLRNHIIFAWHSRKPNYLTKGEIRKGFKPSEKDTVGQIHRFLEQIGAINYGCARVRYIRPLEKIFKKDKKSHSQPQRFKKKFLNNGEGGCTVSHGVNGEIIDTTVINEDPVHPKVKVIKKKDTLLINCKTFESPYKFKVEMNLATLLLMDFHAHTSLSEVMGLIGGSWDCDSATLMISHYEPCKNIASSSTHCDMCPVSQAESAEIINDKGLDVFGWFHSHPVFPPEPSQQDLDTQRQLQFWIGEEKPCIGFILSPFNRPMALLPSDYRCLVVDKLEGDQDFLPYKFNVEIVTDYFDLDRFVADIVKIRDFIDSSCENQDESLKITLKQPYLHDKRMTYLDKYMSSMKLTAKASKFGFPVHILNEMIRGVVNACSDEVM